MPIAAVVTSVQPPVGRETAATVRYQPDGDSKTCRDCYFVLDDPPPRLADFLVGVALVVRETDVLVRGKVWAISTGRRRYRLAPKFPAAAPGDAASG